MDLVPDGGDLDQEVRRLENTYFDTPGAGLRMFGITLRRRVGGSETGWQLKVPNGTARTELQSGSRTKTLPPALAEAIAGLLAGETLEQVATLVTTRTVYRLRNATGELVLEIVDDHVESGLGESTLQSWREAEVELGPAGKKKDVKRAGKILLAAGATLSTTRTKLDRALGPTLPNGRQLRSNRAPSGTWWAIPGSPVRCARKQRRRLADRSASRAPNTGGRAPTAQHFAGLWRRGRRRSS